MRPPRTWLALVLTVFLSLAIVVERAEAAADGEGKPVILVTASPPLEAERLADALRVYLDTPGWEVEVLPPTPAANHAANDEERRSLDGWLAAQRHRQGEPVRAVALVRVENEGQALTLDILDRATDKALVARLAPPERPADLYRALALKTRALLRASFSEEPATAETSSLLAILPPRPAPRPAANRPFLGVAWQERTFFRGARHEGSPTFSGMAISVSFPLGARWWLGAEVDALLPARATVGQVAVLGTRVPLLLHAGASWPIGRWEGRGAILLEGAYVGIASSSTATVVRDARGLAVSAGGEVELAYAVRDAWTFRARLAALQSLWSLETTVRGNAALDMSGWSLLGAIGVGLAF